MQDEEADLLSDYKTAIVSANMADTRRELEQYLSLCCISITVCKRREIIDSACDVFIIIIIIIIIIRFVKRQNVKDFRGASGQEQSCELNRIKSPTE